MKNLMLGLAVAALCGSAVGATAGTVVTSTKTVGYRNTATANGYKLVTPTFVNTDGEALPITAVTVTGTGTVTLKTFGSNGAFGDTYTWQDGNEDNNNVAGWYNGQTVCKDLTFKKGEGFVTSADAETAKVCIAGLVPSGSVSYSLPAGYSIIGNPFNTGVSIQKFKLNVGGMYNANLQSIGADGQTAEIYYWVSDDIAGEGAGGWYKRNNQNLERLSDVTAQPGTTYLLYTVGAATLTIE